MGRYEPAYGVYEASEAIRAFVRTHHGLFSKILFPLIPFLFLFSLINEVFTLLPVDFGGLGTFIGQIFVSVCNYTLTLMWYRVVVQGADNYKKINFLKLTENEVMFFAVNIAFSVLIWGGYAALSGVFQTTSFGVIALYVLIWSFFLYVSYRIGFYFVALAVGDNLSFKQAVSLSKGYLVKMIFASIWSTIRVAFVAIFVTAGLYGLVYLLFYLLSAVNMLMFVPDNMVDVGRYFANLPVLLYFTPLLTVLTANVIANYYQYARQNSEGVS